MFKTQARKATEAFQARIAAVNAAREEQAQRERAARMGTGDHVDVDKITEDVDNLHVKEEDVHLELPRPSGDNEGTDTILGEEEDEDAALVRAAQTESLRLTEPPAVKQEEEVAKIEEEEEEEAGGEDEVASVVEEKKRVFLPFPEPDGTDVASASFAKKAREVVNVHEGDDDGPLHPAMYIFDTPEVDEETEVVIASALAVANAGAPQPDTIYAPLHATPEQKQKQKQVDYTSLRRIHAPWPVDLVTSEKSMEEMETADIRAAFPLPASAYKKDYMAWQMDPTRNYGDSGAFSIPLPLVKVSTKKTKRGDEEVDRSIAMPAIVVSASFKEDPINTLRDEVPGSTWGAALASVSVEGFQCERKNLPELEKNNVIHTLSEENAALFNSPEFRRWAGVDAEAVKHRLRTEIKSALNEDGSKPDPSTLFHTTYHPELEELAGHVNVPLVLRPRTLSQFLVLSHAADLHVATQNIRRSSARDTTPPLLLKLDLAIRSAADLVDPTKADEAGYIGHVLVHLHALDAVIDHYCTKFHPGKLAASTTLLKIIPDKRAMADLTAMASAENKAGAFGKFMMLRADLNVTFLPYNGPIHHLPGVVNTLIELKQLIDASYLDGTDEALRKELVAEGLDPEDENPCYTAVVSRFVERKMAERAVADDDAAWDAPYIPPPRERFTRAGRAPSTGPKPDIWDEAFIPSHGRGGGEQRAQSARDMRRVPRLTAPSSSSSSSSMPVTRPDPRDNGDAEWHARKW